MAISQFVPEFWAGPLLANLREQGIYLGLANRNYEGLISREGDTVHITSFADPAVRDYVKNTDISWDLLTDATRALVVDQADYFAISVDDVDRRQAIAGFINGVTQGAANNMALEADEYVSGLMVAAINGTGQDLGAQVWDISDNTAYGFIIAMRTKLNRANVPAAGRWLVVPPEGYAALLQDPRFVDASRSGSTDALRAGQVGRIAGFDVFESNVVPTPTAGTYHVIAGHNMAVTFADQIGPGQVEAVRLQNQFGDGIRGMHLYGAKVIYPTALVLASVTVQA
jgi:hypothetical protein